MLSLGLDGNEAIAVLFARPSIDIVNFTYRPKQFAPLR
jgi:hypothetical protein